MRLNKNKLIKSFVRVFGMEAYKPGKFPKDIDAETIKIIEAVTPYTMIGRERLQALITATRYIVRNGIEGAVVECGVWRGGASAAAALALKDLDETRDMYMFDTFEGMPEPTKEDKSFGNDSAMEVFNKLRTSAKSSSWDMASLEDVRANLTTLGLNAEGFTFVKGMVEDTIPEKSPDGAIALLRLDTDWYKSTKHEMDHLFPKLVPGGVLIIDDYGDWQGAREAIDEYIETHKTRILLTRVDGSVIGVKCA